MNFLRLKLGYWIVSRDTSDSKDFNITIFSKIFLEFAIDFNIWNFSVIFGYMEFLSVNRSSKANEFFSDLAGIILDDAFQRQKLVVNIFLK